jgi:hypothetical protein
MNPALGQVILRHRVGGDDRPARQEASALTHQYVSCPWRISGGGCGELCLVLEQIAVLRRQYRRHGCAGCRMFVERCHGLAFVRSERGDVRQSCNLWMVPGFSDHRSSVGVADEDCRSVLRCKSSLGNRYVALQRYCRILDNADTVAVSREDLVDTSQPGPSTKAPCTRGNQCSILGRAQSESLCPPELRIHSALISL